MRLKPYYLFGLGFLSVVLFNMSKKDEGQNQVFKVTLELDLDTIQEIDRMVLEQSNKHSGNQTTRVTVCQSALKQALNRGYATREEQMRVYSRLIDESVKLKEKATALLKQKEHHQSASSLFLMAASKELEALSVVNERNESLIKAAFIQVMMLLKRATGYRVLPDVPIPNNNVELQS